MWTLLVVLFLLCEGPTTFAAKKDEQRSLRNKKSSSSSSSSSKSKKSSSSQQTVGSGETFLTSSVSGLKIKDKSTSCKIETNDGYITSKCLEIKTTTIANHVMGPWCSGGFWDKKNVNFPTSSIHSCLCQRFHCDTTCDDMCMECTPESKSLTYLIPLEPYLLDDGDTLGAHDDNNFGDGLALNGVPLAKSDPFSELTGQNNIAPLDPNGGHSTLQMTYHYHAIPTIFFDCQSGWDPTNLVWASEAPDGNHSPQIGWGLDGIPVYGPFSTGGAVPKDLDNCGAHSHDEYGMHYHANFNGETQAAFLGCYKGARAVQDWDGSSFDDDGSLTDAADCPVTTYLSAHAIEDSMSKYFSTVGEFSSKSCKDVSRVISR